MRHELIVRTRGNNVNLLTLDDDELQQYLYNFMAEVVNEYLIGSLVNIGAALDKQEIWDEVWRRVGQPMYYAGVGLLDPKEIFVCGRPPDLKRSKAYIPPKAIQVRTNSEEWLIVVASYRGGQPTKLVVDKLFPVK